MSSLILKNQRVYDFYDKHKHFDFEKMNMLLVDLLENFQESAFPSLNTNMASKMFQQLEQMQIQIQEKDQIRQLEWLKQMNEWKTQHIEDLKGVIQSNHVDQVLPLLKEQVEQFHGKLVQWQHQSQDDTIQTHSEMTKKAIQQDIELLSQKTLQRDHLQDYTRTLEDRLSMLTSASESRLQERFREHARDSCYHTGMASLEVWYDTDQESIDAGC